MKPRILNFGSINIDHVYRVDHFVQAGETLASESMSTVLGGKGANQSVAIARAGGDVKHLGRLSEADQWVSTYLEASGVDISLVESVAEPSGHAIIQVDSNGENSILLHGGANQGFDHASLESAIGQYNSGDYLLLQNETNAIAHAFDLAISQGLKVVLKPAPMSEHIRSLPLEKLDTLIVNLGEAQALASQEKLDHVVETLAAKMPHTRILITLGEQGVVFVNSGDVTKIDATTANVVDTTAAGDTFVGYFIASVVDGLKDLEALDRACRAAALAVESFGAMPSIPTLDQLEG